MSLLYSTAYYPQTEGASKRTNQTAEIALCFHISTMESPSEWPKVLPSIQASNNNSVSSTTKRAPNKVTYSFISNRPIDLATNASLTPGSEELPVLPI